MGEYIGIFYENCMQTAKMAKLPCRQQKRLTYRFEINRLSLKISENNIVYRIPWY